MHRQASSFSQPHPPEQVGTGVSGKGFVALLLTLMGFLFSSLNRKQTSGWKEEGLIFAFLQGSPTVQSVLWKPEYVLQIMKRGLCFSEFIGRQYCKAESWRSLSGLNAEASVQAIWFSDDVAGHSRRAGHVTLSIKNGTPETWILRQSGHTSINALRKYERPNREFEASSAAKIGL